MPAEISDPAEPNGFRGSLTVLETAFAPAERASQSDVWRQHRKLAQLPFVREFLDAVPNMTMVLNQQRQIVLANRAFSEFLGLKAGDQLGDNRSREAVGPVFLGHRPGEAAGCIRAHLTAGGCGTTPYCQTCGAVIAILNSQKFQRLDIQECRMLRGAEGADGTALDLRVWARPIEVAGEHFTVFSVVDISQEKRHKVLERIFFHDVINTASCIKGLADLLLQTELSAAEIQEMRGMISESADQLLEEISAQRELADAENGDLKPEAKPMESLELLAQIVRQFNSHSLARGKPIVVAAAESFTFISDPVLVRRVLVNLVKNALEASASGETVTLGAQVDGEDICLTVHNVSVMPPAVRLQIFSRSFSTKGSGRGLGTYSIKLITEKYLCGRVAFVSNAGVGTRFTVRYPRVLAAA
jgi:signal transduction histidine kinase